MKTVTQNGYFRKRSPKWIFSKTPFTRLRVDSVNGYFRKRRGFCTMGLRSRRLQPFLNGSYLTLDSSHPEIFSSATGENVSSIDLYSVGDPVLQVWNRWFRSANSYISKFLLPPASSALRISGIFNLGSTCRSFEPLSIRVGHFTFRRAGRGS